MSLLRYTAAYLRNPPTAAAWRNGATWRSGMTWRGVTPSAQAFSDNFNRADALTLGANWTPLSAYGNNFKIVSNTVTPESIYQHAEAWSTPCSTNDNYSEVTMVGTASGQGVVCRGTYGSDLIGYLAAWNTTDLKLYSYAPGVITLIGSVGITPVNGDVLKVSAVGSTITVYINGTQTIQVTNSTITSGKRVGLFNEGSSTGVFDNWSGGDVVSVPSLTIQNATHDHTADNVDLVQHHVLTIQDATHDHTADNVTLTQHHVLVIQDATHDHSADNVTLTVVGSLTLTIQDAVHTHTADNVTLTQHHVLVIQNATHAHTAENLDLVQHYAALIVQNATHAHSADNITLTQHQVLVIQDATHVHTADEVVLSVTGLWTLWTGTEFVELTVEGVWNGSSIEPLTAWTGELV